MTLHSKINTTNKINTAKHNAAKARNTHFTPTATKIVKTCVLSSENLLISTGTIPSELLAAAYTMARSIHSTIAQSAERDHAILSSSVCILGYQTTPKKITLYGGGYFLAKNPPWCIPSTKVALSVLSSAIFLENHISVVFWFDPLGQRLLSDFIFSELEIVRALLHAKTLLVHLNNPKENIKTENKTTEIPLQDVLSKNFFASLPALTEPVKLVQRGTLNGTQKNGTAHDKEKKSTRHIGKITNFSSSKAGEQHLIETVLPVLRRALEHSYSNGRDRPARKAHSAAVIFQEELSQKEGSATVVITTNYRHPSHGFLACCAETLAIAIANSEGLTFQIPQISYVIVYSQDYISKDTGQSLAPAICGTCESVISDYVDSENSKIIVFACGDDAVIRTTLTKNPYSKLEFKIR
jgi:cytidine deaminase